MKGPESSLINAVESYADIRTFGTRTARVLRETAGIIAAATSGDRLAALKSAAEALAKEVRDGWIDRPSAADRIYNAAVAYGVVNAHGNDAVQAILGAAFAQPAAQQTPQSKTQTDNAELDAKIVVVGWHPAMAARCCACERSTRNDVCSSPLCAPGLHPRGRHALGWQA